MRGPVAIRELAQPAGPNLLGYLLGVGHSDTSKQLGEIDWASHARALSVGLRRIEIDGYQAVGPSDTFDPSGFRIDLKVVRVGPAELHASLIPGMPRHAPDACSSSEADYLWEAEGMRSRACLAALAWVTVAVFSSVGCDGETSTETGSMRRGGLTTAPRENLDRACTELAKTTRLHVYCPGSVPVGPLRVDGHGTFADASTYALSLESPSLPFAGRDELHAGHWVVAAARPASAISRQVDWRLRFPDNEFDSKAGHLAVKGINATVLEGDISGPGWMSLNHRIVYWHHAGTGYLLSVHEPGASSITERLARAWIAEIAG
jgi:hypothetical protein